ncbi:MAG: hypothetical protein IIX17_06530 [Tidjanibacter sp.]|nr:hypothetical protein [Tidjanibacter sp.]
MKKLLLVFALFFAATSVSAQEFDYDYFYNLATEERYELEVSLDEDDNIEHIFIEVDGETYDQVYIKVKAEQLNAFHSALRKVKSKFLEWEQVAKDNGVTDFEKEIEVDFPELEAYWYCDDDWKDSFSSEPYVLFVVDEEGDSYVGIGDYVEDWEDDSYSETYFFILSYEVDFDDLINKTSLNYIRQKINEINVDSLFQNDDDVDSLFS